jgi:phage repressor protein C with HTH and peptisase S24 domain
MLKSSDIIEEPPSNVLFLEHISAVAGYSIETFTEEELSYFSIPYLPKRSSPYIAIRIQGDSMEPRFYSGDIVICYKIERFEDFKSNNYYIVSYQGEVRFKFVYASPGAADLLILKSVNTMYIEEAVPIGEVELFRVVASLKLL